MGGRRSVDRMAEHQMSTAIKLGWRRRGECGGEEQQGINRWTFSATIYSQNESTPKPATATLNISGFIQLQSGISIRLNSIGFINRLQSFIVQSGQSGSFSVVWPCQWTSNLLQIAQRIDTSIHRLCLRTPQWQSATRFHSVIHRVHTTTNSAYI